MTDPEREHGAEEPERGSGVGILRDVVTERLLVQPTTTTTTTTTTNTTTTNDLLKSRSSTEGVKFFSGDNFKREFESSKLSWSSGEPQYAINWVGQRISATADGTKYNLGTVVSSKANKPLDKKNKWTIWILNLVCFIVHSAMVFLTLHLAYWRHGRNPATDTEHVMVPIYRIRSVPTQEMLDRNETKWIPGWNFTSSNPNSGLFLYENSTPINFASLIISFFATSALFHLLVLVLAGVDHFRNLYWKQLRQCFSWWCAHI